MPKTPNEPKVAEFISKQIELCGKTQKEIAEEVGFKSANLVTMIKQGTTKLPLNKVNAFADALGVSRARLMILVLDEYHPGVLDAIEDALGTAEFKRRPSKLTS